MASEGTFTLNRVAVPAAYGGPSGYNLSAVGVGLFNLSPCHKVYMRVEQAGVYVQRAREAGVKGGAWGQETYYSPGVYNIAEDPPIRGIRFRLADATKAAFVSAEARGG